MFGAAGRLNAVLRAVRGGAVNRGLGAGAEIPRFMSESMAASPSTRPLLLSTWGTPNGKKVSVMLEELKAAYGLEYELSVTGKFP